MRRRLHFCAFVRSRAGPLARDVGPSTWKEGPDSERDMNWNSPVAAAASAAWASTQLLTFYSCWRHGNVCAEGGRTGEHG